MQLSLGDPKPVRLDDGVTFMVAPVRSRSWAFSSSALVINEEIREKAAALLPAAQHMADAKSTRLNFFRRSREALNVAEGTDDGVYALAELEAQEAAQRVALLFALASGDNCLGNKIIGVDDWRSILFFFHQDVSVGAVKKLEG